MSSRQSQYHLLRITLCIKKIVMAVRFPCSLQFQLKNESNFIEGRLAYQLRDGKCQPNEKMAIDVDIPNKNSEYPDTKITLLILMASFNGKIPAGSIQLKITQKGKIRQAQNHENNVQNYIIEKCPDKFATIDLIIKTEFVRSFSKSIYQDIQQGIIQSPSNHFNNRKKIIPYGYNTLTHHTSYDKILIQNSRERADTIKKIQSPESGRDKNSFHQSPKLVLSKKKSISNSNDSGSLIDQSLLEINHQTEQYFKKKMRKIIKQKQSCERQITKLKGEIHTLRRSQQWRNGSIQDQISKYRHEIDSLAHEMVQIKQKNKQLERKQKQLASQHRDQKEQIEKYKIRCAGAEANYGESKLIIQQKQKLIKVYDDQIKKLKQQVEDLKISNTMQQKKIQYKQTTYKQQIKKLTQKYQISENERQKLTLEINNMLGQFEINEKKIQINFKEKEKSYLDQKNKMGQRVQVLTVQISTLSQQKRELKSLIEEYRSQLAQINLKYMELDQKLKQMTSSEENLKIISKKQQATILQMTKQIQQLEVYEKQLGFINKKYIELTSQNSKNIQQIARFTQKCDTLQKSIKDLQVNLKDSNSIKDAHSIKITDSNKQIQRLKKYLQTKQSQILSITQCANVLNKKLNEMKLKLESERMEYQNGKNKNQSQILYLIRTKDQLQSELDQQKWKFSRSEQLNVSNVAKITNLNEKLLKINEEFINQQQKCKQFRQTIKQYESRIVWASNDLLSKQTKQKQLNAMLKTKNDLEYNLQKQIKQKEQQIFLLKDKQNQMKAHLTERDQIIDIISKQKQEYIMITSSHIKTIQQELSVQAKNKQDVIKQLAKLQEQIQYHKTGNNEVRKLLGERDTQLQQINQKMLILEQRLDEAKKKQDEYKYKIGNREQELNKSRLEWQTYRQASRTALMQFIIEINKDNSQADIVKNNSHLSFLDGQLSALQVEAYRKRNQILIKFREEANSQREEIVVLSIELGRIKEYAKYRETELQNQILSQLQHHRSVLFDNLSQKNEIIDRLHTIEQKSHQLGSLNEKLQQEHKRLQQEYTELQCHHQGLMQQNKKLEQKIRQLHKQIDSINVVNSINKNASNGELLSIVQESKSQIDKHKSQIRDLQKKLSLNNKEQQQQNQYINKIQSKFSEQSHLRQKLQKKIEFFQKKCIQLQDMRKLQQNKTTSLEQKVKQEQGLREKVTNEFNKEKYHCGELRLQNIKLRQEIEQLSTKLSKLEMEIKQLMDNSIYSDIHTKKMENAYKMTSQKANLTIKELRQQIIQLNSEIQLKNFLIQQLETTNEELKNAILLHSNQSSQRRTHIIKLQQQLENLKNQNIFIHQNYESLNTDKQSVEMETKKLKQIVETMTTRLMENNVLCELLGTKQKDYDRLKDEYEHMQNKFDVNNRQLKLHISDLKRELAVKCTKEDELKKKIRQLQKQLSYKSYQLANQTIRNKDESDRERQQVVRTLDVLTAENSRLKSQCEYLREHGSKQIEQANQECAQLARLLTEKEEMLMSKADQLKQSERRTKMLNAELKNCLEAWDREKLVMRVRSGAQVEIGSTTSRFQRTIDDINNRSRQLEGRAKKNSSEMEQAG